MLTALGKLGTLPRPPHPRVRGPLLLGVPGALATAGAEVTPPAAGGGGGSLSGFAEWLARVTLLCPDGPALHPPFWPRQ